MRNGTAFRPCLAKAWGTFAGWIHTLVYEKFCWCGVYSGLTRQVVNSVGIRMLERILGSVPATEAAAIYLAGCLNSLTNSKAQ